MENTPTTKTPLEKGFERILTPFQAFIHDQATSSMLLVASTIVALVIANSPLSNGYQVLLDTKMGFVFDDLSLTMTLRHWINEGLMAFFFFLIGMEIKREIMVGELRKLSRFMPVFAAALGGMLIPASIYVWFNSGTSWVDGWGIPMATDTAFAIGILALLGRRIPTAAFAFLTALAIIDDLGAIVVIALFYSHSISTYHLGLSAALLLLLVLMNALGIRRASVYFVGGILIWLAMLGSGIHATVTGILVAATIPARPKQEAGWFFQRTEKLLDRIKHIEKKRPATMPILGEYEQHALVEDVKDAAERTTAPLRRWERALDKPISLFVMPVFALANAGIPLTTHMFTGIWTNTLSTGIILGLVAGKAIGVTAFTWTVLHLKLGKLPSGLNMQHITGLGLLAGIGFTMSIFISNLAFEAAEEALVNAKSAILTASFIAGILGYTWLRLSPRENNDG